MLVGKARSLPKRRAPERGFIGESSGFAQKHFTRLEWPVWDKHSSLLRTFVHNVRKKFYETGPWDFTAPEGATLE